MQAQHRAGTTAANAVALWGLSTPNFWLGIMLILLFSVTLGWLPASGFVSPFEDWKANLAALIMPAFVLGNAIAAVLMRHTRSAMLQVLSSDYVRTARAKGLSERSVILKHALRNALIPVITLGALELGTLLSGAVLTEQVFTIPGFGKLIVDAVFNRDYAVVQGVVLFTATAYILLNLARRHRVRHRQSADPGAVMAPRDDAAARVRPMPPRVAARASVPAAAAPRAARRSGLVVIVIFVVLALLAPLSRPTIRSPRAGARSARRRPRRTGSAPTKSAATCCRASSGARARRCSRAWSRRSSRCRSACPSVSWRAMRAAGPTC